MAVAVAGQGRQAGQAGTKEEVAVAVGVDVVGLGLFSLGVYVVTIVTVVTVQPRKLQTASPLITA